MRLLNAFSLRTCLSTIQNYDLGAMLMKHKVKIQVPVEKHSFLGMKKTVMETRTIEVDDKTYRKLKKEWNNRPYSAEEMMFYDDLFGD